jgi:hypothetical protein
MVQMAKTNVYYCTELITGVKCFIVPVPECLIADSLDWNSNRNLGWNYQNHLKTIYNCNLSMGDLFQERLQS